METERKALGLQGIRFLYYTCSACGYHDIFIDIHPLEGETAEEFRTRHAALEATVKQLKQKRPERTEVVIVEK